MNNEEKPKSQNVICCGYFEKILHHFGWFSIHVSDKKLCMPYMLSGDEKIKVNYCPVCGKEVIGIEIEPELLRRFV